MFFPLLYNETCLMSIRLLLLTKIIKALTEFTLQQTLPPKHSLLSSKSLFPTKAGVCDLF